MTKSLEDLQNTASELVVKLMYQDMDIAKLGMIITEFGSLIPQQIYPLWIKDSKQLKEFLIEAVPFSFGFSESEDEIPEEILQIVASLKDGDPPSLSAADIENLNSIMNDSQIRWIGTFNELCDGKGEVAKEIICLFRNDQNYKNSIQEDEREDFKIFITKEIHY